MFGPAPAVPGEHLRPFSEPFDETPAATQGTKSAGNCSRIARDSLDVERSSRCAALPFAVLHEFPDVMDDPDAKSHDGDVIDEKEHGRLVVIPETERVR